MKTILLENINKSKKIAIFSHINPDADALCSSCALKNLILNNFDNKFVDIFIDGEIGELYDPILRNEVINPKPYLSYDLAFIMDCPDLNRVGSYKNLVKQIGTAINIDHHKTNTKFANINLVAPQTSSTCEIVYLIAKTLDLEINNVVAKEIYQGIITDTNCFTSLSVTSKSHQVISELMKFNFDANLIKEYYFKNNSKDKTLLLAKALQTLKFFENQKIVTMEIPNKLFTKLDISFEDTMGLIDNATNIESTIVSAILIEKEPEKIYCSLRSKGQVDVGEIAKIFNGGGSDVIAAFQITGNIEEIKKLLVDTISPFLTNITTTEKSIF